MGGGEGGIRTRDGFPHTAFPVPRTRPLCDLSMPASESGQGCASAAGRVSERLDYRPSVRASVHSHRRRQPALAPLCSPCYGPAADPARTPAGPAAVDSHGSQPRGGFPLSKRLIVVLLAMLATLGMAAQVPRRPRPRPRTRSSHWTHQARGPPSQSFVEQAGVTEEAALAYRGERSLGDAARVLRCAVDQTRELSDLSEVPAASQGRGRRSEFRRPRGHPACASPCLMPSPSPTRTRSRPTS